MNHSPKRKGRPPSATLAQARPDLAAQLKDPSLASQLSKGSDKSVEWQCAEGHEWTAKVYNRTNAKNNTGCPVCNGKKVQVGFNDVATTHPDVAALFSDQTVTTTVTAFSNKSVLMRCLVDPSHDWKSPPSRIAAGKGGCPYCSGRLSIASENDLATTHPVLASQLIDQTLTTSLKAGSNVRVEWRCDQNPAHIWTATPYSRTTKRSKCPVCTGRVAEPGVTDLATTHPEIAATLMDQALSTKLSQGSGENVWWQCPTTATHTWRATVFNRVHRSGCPVCANRMISVGENDLATTHPELASQLVDPALATQISYGSGQLMQWSCSINPDHTWVAFPYHRSGRTPTGCPQCLGPLPSKGEKGLAEIIKVLVSPENVLTSDQTILPGRHELDIVVPSRQFAVEFNGTYWHSEASGKPASYHAVKSAAAMAAGYQLMHVWEDDWSAHPEIVVRAIAHKLHATARLLNVLPDADPKIAERIYARSMVLGETRGAEAAAFLDANHIQGSVVATRHFVLRDADGAIRAILSLRSPRNNARMNRRSGVWEIQRYATLGAVPGGFTKLLAAAQKALLGEGTELTQWISFSSHDVSDGGMYSAAGFTAEAQLPVDYKYVGNSTGWRRAPKEAFQRKRFRADADLVWDESWSEREAAQANGLHRVYDSGKTRWIKSVAV